MERTFVKMAVRVNGSKLKVKEEVNDDHNQRPVLASALNSILEAAPVGVGSNEVTVTWKYIVENHEDHNDKGEIKVDVYRSSKMQDISDYIAGEIIGGINTGLKEKIAKKAKNMLENLLHGFEEDEDLTDEEKFNAQESIKILQGFSSILG